MCGIVVYDCGSLNRNILTQRVIPGCLPEGSEIDILFVSHFHADHINGIASLKKKYKIKTVVFPLVNSLTRNLTLIYNFVTRGRRAMALTRRMIDKPQGYFSDKGEETSIVFVRPTNDPSNDRVHEHPISIDNLQQKKVLIAIKA